MKGKDLAFGCFVIAALLMIFFFVFVLGVAIAQAQKSSAPSVSSVLKGLSFQKTTVVKLAAGQCKMTRAQLTGRVELVKKEADGDLHIRIGDGSHFVVAECMPELPCTKPKVGDTVRVRGITRFDNEHKWYEIHPVEHLEVLASSK